MGSVGRTRILFFQKGRKGGEGRGGGGGGVSFFFFVCAKQVLNSACLL